MNILIACEFSGVVKTAFRDNGHDAWSCDFLPCESEKYNEYHYRTDVLEVICNKKWDMIIAFPPCTYLCSSGMHWTTRGFRDPTLTEDAIKFVENIMCADCEKIVIENPVGVLSTRIRKPDQIIQPWMFGEDASKKTCLWLQGVERLEPTDIIKKKRYLNQTKSGQNKLGPSKDRAKLRSITYKGIAEAMADQWS